MTRSRNRACLLALGALALAFAPLQATGADEEATDGWSGSLNLGGSLTTGNTDSFSGSLEATATHEWEVDSITGTAKGIYGYTDSAETANAQSLVGRYRHDWTDRFFGYAQAEGGRDAIQLIRWRALLSAGPGYRIWEAGKKRYLDAELGAGYRHEAYLRETDGRGPDPAAPRPDRQETRDDANARLAWEYLDLWGDALEVKHNFEILLPVNDPAGFLFRTGVVFAVPISDAWFFRTAFDLQYLNTPATDQDGNDLKKFDTKTTVGLEYRF
jgi:putative salt-induced outer membrane protein YdiY